MDLGSLTQWYLENLDYWVLTVLMILENSLIPLPAELIVTPAAYKAANGEMNLFMVMFCTTFGTVIGALINYGIARTVGRALVYRFADSKIGHLCALNRQKMEYVEGLFLRHGKTSTFIGRIIPAGRQFISIPAGLARMNLYSFVLYTTLGSTLWNSFLVLIGYALASVYSQEELIEVLKLRSIEFSIGFILFLGLIYVIKLLWKKYRNQSAK